MFTSWYNIMCDKNIKIKKISRICELHFKSEDIIREDAFLQEDESVIYVKRKNPKLKEGAIPSIFLIQKSIPCYQQIECENNSNVMSSEEFLIEYETLETVSHSAEESIPSTSHVIKKTLQIDKPLQELLQVENTSFVSMKEIDEFSVKDINIAKNIKVPTVYWFANINNSCMMWTCWTNDLSNILRRVIIKTNMKVQVNIIK